MRVLALTKYGPMAAGTRQRFLQYQPALREAGFEVEFSSLLDDAHMRRLVLGRRTSPVQVAAAYTRRLGILGKARQYDLLWLQYEFFPFMPAMVEALAADFAGKPIILDYDDAVFHRYDRNARWPVRIAAENKLEPLLRRAAACCCGNSYVERYAAQFCPNTMLLPTVVDANLYRPAVKVGALPLTIGWIGSPSTWHNVRPILPLLREICREGGVVVRAIGAGVAAEGDRFPGLELIEWSEATEIAEVQRMDIGIMPLIDEPFERGKSGYKLIQYMACGLPVVASPVGVNSEIVIDGESGFLAADLEAWRAALMKLIADPRLRRSLGDAGRQRAEVHYSLASQAPRLVELFRSITG